MLKLSRNKFLPVFAILAAGIARSACALPIDSFLITGVAGNSFTAGVTTNTPTTTIRIFTFDENSGVPDPGEVVTLQLLDNGTVIPNGIFPSSFTTVGGNQVNGGNASLPLTFFRAGSSIQLRAVAAGASLTSGAFTVNVSSAVKLVVLGPGMTHFPGTNPAATDGTSGSFTPQTPNQPFIITVILTDNQFNQVAGTDNVSFTSGDLITLPSPAALAGGTGDFQVTITGARITRTITVDDTTNAAVADGSLDVTTAGPPTKEVFPFPSPFNPYERDITFRFRLDESKPVKLTVIDLMGQEVWTKDISASAGFTDVTWNGRNSRGTVVAAGVYYVMFEIDGSIESKKRFGVIK